MPKVTVIMPIYNAEDTLDKCFSSIVNQTVTDWELICCDDNSNDNSYEKLKEWQRKDSRIVVLKNSRNMKASFTRNKCLEIAKGDYIALVDDDDYCKSNRFETQIEFLEKNPEYSIVGSSVYLYDENGVWGKRTVPEKPTKWNFLWSSPFINPTIMIKKQALLEVKGYRVVPETNRGQDYDLFMRMYAKGFKGFNLEEPLMYYYRGIKGYKKTSFKIRLDEAKVRKYNFKQLSLLPVGYLFVLKPIILGLIPFSFLERIKRKFSKE